MLISYKFPYYNFNTHQLLGTYQAAAPSGYSTPSNYSSSWGDPDTLSDVFEKISAKYSGIILIDPIHVSYAPLSTQCLSQCGASPYINAWDFIGKSIEFVYYNSNNIKLSIVIEFTLSVDNPAFKQIDLRGTLYRNGSAVGSSRPISSITAEYSTDSTHSIIQLHGVSIPFINFDNPTTGVPFLIYGATANYRMSGTFESPIQEHLVGSNLNKQFWNQNNFNTWVNGYEPEEYDDGNAYIDGGTSEEGGGGGNFSDGSDDVDVDQLPTYDSIGTGFATIFTPTKYQLKDLADVMWDNGIFQALQNLVENISNMFTSLAIVPFEVTPGSTVSVNFLGLFDTGISLRLAANQYFEFNMGAIDLANDSRIYTSGSALDYSPFSKLGIFLPFIGFQDLDIDECRGATIGLKYRIDILSGTCVALISIGGNTIYQFTGNCLSQIPITNENMQSLVTDAVNVGIAAAATHSASGAASADMTAAESGESSLAKEAKYAHAESHLVSSQGRLASATANAAMGMKPTFGKAGAISASASLLAVKQPYLFLTTPRQSIPEHYQRYCGFPSNITGKLNEFSGYTVVEDIRLNGLVATSPEVAEIYQLLKSGVII